MVRSICSVVSVSCSEIRDTPLAIPSRKPIEPPTRRPAKARPALTSTSFGNWPETVVDQKARPTSAGDGMMRDEIQPAEEASCQNATIATGTR